MFSHPGARNGRSRAQELRPSAGCRNLTAPEETAWRVDLMNKQSNRTALRLVVESLKSSLRDIAAIRVHDSRAVQAEARRMLA